MRSSAHFSRLPPAPGEKHLHYLLLRACFAWADLHHPDVCHHSLGGVGLLVLLILGARCDAHLLRASCGLRCEAKFFSRETEQARSVLVALAALNLSGRCLGCGSFKCDCLWHRLPAQYRQRTFSCASGSAVISVCDCASFRHTYSLTVERSCFAIMFLCFSRTVAA